MGGAAGVTGNGRAAGRARLTVSRLKPAAWGEDVTDVENAAGNSLFKAVELRWSKPTLWTRDMSRPKFHTEAPFLYALIRNHGNALTKDRIVYIGLTSAPATRFGNHQTAKEIVSLKGQVGFSYAPIEFGSGNNRLERVTYALEQIEHLLIWAVDQHLENEKKMFTLPGMGANGGDAWHITNTGYRFSGQMPKEIVFPWMLVKPGRDRTAKTRQDT